MPLYEYHCPACSANLELLVRFGDQPVCPHCGSTQMERQLSTFSAATANSPELPVCQPAPGGCGIPGCGPGGCGMG